MGILFQKASRRLWAVILVFVMMIGIVGPVSQAKVKVKLAKSKITVKVKQTKKVKIKNIKKKQVRKLTVKSKKTSVATAKKAGKVAIKVTGKKKGSAKVIANLKLKKKVGGKKSYKLKLNVEVKKAGLAPTAAPTLTPTATPIPPVISGASISLEKQEYKCTVNGELVKVAANLLPDTANEPVKWKILDEKVAEIVETAPTEGGVAAALIVGVGVGITYITATIGAGSTTAKIEVGEEVIAAQLAQVKQTKADEIVATLDTDYRMDNQGLGKGKFDIDVYNDKGVVVKTIPVNKISYELVAVPAASGAGVTVTGTSATLSLDSPFADKDKVVVNLYKGKDFASSKDFTASVGAPVAINLVTLEAERDVETPIKIALFDSNGIDVTSTVDVDSRVAMNISGDDATWNTSPISKANIRMTKLDSIATVMVSYTSAANSTGKPDFQGAGVITCVAPKPVVGDPHYAILLGPKYWEGSEDKVARFYRGEEDFEDISVGVGDYTEYSFYASSKEDGEAISYDEYSVMSSNGDVASATVEGTGKFCNITIEGIKAGKCNINVMAKKNTVTTNYVIPVKVIKKGELKKFSISPTRKTVSNAFDDLYQAENKITVSAEDSEEHDLSAEDGFQVSFEVTKPKNYGEPFSFKHSDGEEIILGGGFSLEETRAGAKFNTAGAKPGTYTISATAYYNGVSMTSTCTINVKALPKEVYEFNGNAPKAEYSIEASTKDIRLSLAGEGVAKVRLKATIGGLFAGYVYMGGYDTTVYPEGNYSEFPHHAWRSGFVSGDYIGVIGDEVAFSSGTTGCFVTTNDGRLALLGSNLVSKHYQVNGASQILDLRGAVQSGVRWQTDQQGYPNENLPGEWSSASNFIYINDKGTNLTATSFTSGSVILEDTGERALVISIYDEKNESEMMEFYPDKKKDTFLALPGTYKTMLKWKQPKDSKSSQKSNLVAKSASVDIKVIDDIDVPKIDVVSRTLTDFSEEGVMEVLRPACDLNCNISRHASVLGLYDKDFKPVEFDGNSVVVNYVKVIEGAALEDMYIYVPLGAAFTKKQ